MCFVKKVTSPAAPSCPPKRRISSPEKPNKGLTASLDEGSPVDRSITFPVRIGPSYSAKNL